MKLRSKFTTIGLLWCTDTSDPGHFGMTEVSGHFGTGAEVSYGHFGTGAEVS